MNKTLVLISATLVAPFSQAANAQFFDLTWHTIDGGGIGRNTVVSTSVSYSLAGAIGQHDASSIASPLYRINAGFWAVPQPCRGDADGNAVVNFSDITFVLANLGTSYAPTTGNGDADGTGQVNFTDITTVLANLGSVCSLN